MAVAQHDLFTKLADVPAIPHRFVEAKTPEQKAQAYLLITDPGHGWLRVPITETRGIDLSSYSYRDRAPIQFAYLEEDCDLSAFVEHRALRGLVTYYTLQHMESCFIRNLPQLINR